MTEKHTPGPWEADARHAAVHCTNVKIGGPAKLFDVRGWGYLTGTGHGGLGLDPDAAYEIQKANARLAAASPDLLEAAIRILDGGYVSEHIEEERADYLRLRAAVAKATTPGGSDGR